MPKRARAYLVTDDAVRYTAARYGDLRPQLDGVSLNALHGPGAPLYAVPAPPVADDLAPDRDDPGAGTDGDGGQDADDALWAALCSAPPEGWEIGELMHLTGMSRATLYRRLREHSLARRAYQVSRGRWRAWLPDEESP